MGAITIYDNSKYETEVNSSTNPSIVAMNLENKNEIISYAHFKKIEKKVESIQTLSNIDDVEDVADKGTLLTCQLLYEKEINTFCSKLAWSNSDDKYTIPVGMPGVNPAYGGDADIGIIYFFISQDNKVESIRYSHADVERFG